MKKFALTLLAGLTLAATAQAGEDYSAKTPMPPAPEPCLWTWFAGGSIGYLNDMDTEMYTLHVGAEYSCNGGNTSHAVFLEVGYANPSKSFDDDHSRYNTDVDIVPVTLNYKYERNLTGNLNWYIGAGAGVITFDGSSSSALGDFTETEFLGQIFTGLVYNVSDSFEVFGGVRYMYVTDDSLNNLDVYGDDFLYELGVRFNF
jgi:hypothetical protein